MVKLFAAVLAALHLGCAASAMAAEAWPTRAVRVIYPYGPGAGDLMLRPWLEKLSAVFGQQFVIDYKAGASGAIGTEAAVKSAPDGYTFLAVPNPVLTMLPHLRPVTYQWDRDLRPVGRLVTQISGVMMSPKLGLNTLPEVVAYAKAKPEGLTCGSAGPGTVLHVSCVLLARRNGITIEHIPYKGAGEAINDLIGGHISMMAATTSFPQAKAGTIKLVAVLDSERHPEFPEVPTVKETGVKDFEIPVWFALFAPKAAPTEIVERVNAEMVKIARSDEMKARLVSVGFRPSALTTAEMQAQMTKEWTDMAAMLKEGEIKLD